MIFLLSCSNALEYLLNLNIVSQENSEIKQIETQESTKNFNILISLANNCHLLLKQEHCYQKNNPANEFFNEWQFYELFHKFPELKYLSSLVSELIHFDQQNSILVYKYLIDYLDLANFYQKEQTFSTTIAARIGNILARLHSLTFNHQEYYDFITYTPEDQVRYQFGNPAEKIGRISPDIFGLVPANALNFFILYQRYESLRKAIADLETHWYPCCLTHNDLKLNNILIHMDVEYLLAQGRQLDNGILRFIDWERCAWGDPACDLGNLIASYLNIWLSSLVVDPAIKLEESLRLATIPLEVLQPSLVSLILAYLDTFPQILQYRLDFLQRVTQFSGLALIQQIEAMIQDHQSFDNTGICMLQVAKSLLCRPQQAILTLLGMSESELISLTYV
ncbi:MAG: aminoglycoside phosphotransferase family protein [Goleter apudmare HA4340-LM2]|jgi:hypothetical protein|nr:aminoglycoside phosphotransferase family protein [Goleter apudmare HA4340-LM2]